MTKKGIGTLVLVIFLWSIILYSMALLQVHSDTVFLERSKYLDYLPLYDILHRSQAFWHVSRRIPDYFILFAVVSGFVFIFFDARRKVPFWLILKRVLIITGILYGIRAITISVTTVPPASPYCQPKVADSASSYAYLAISQVWGNYTCTDQIYSGHSLTLVISAFVIDYYFSYRLMVPLYYLLAIGGSFTIIVARMHYTVDIVLSWALCYFVFTWYHLIVMQHQNNTGVVGVNGNHVSDHHVPVEPSTLYYAKKMILFLDSP